MKVISLIFFINGFVTMFCCGQQKDTTFIEFPEVQPTFKYDTCSNSSISLKAYFMNNYKMPEIILDNGYFGKIYVEFIVEKDSSLSSIKLIRGIDNPLDKSVIEFIKTMPKWNPGRNNGQTVRTRFILPVSIQWLYGKMDK